MSYLDRKEAIEDFQREGPPPPASDEFINGLFESYYCSKIKRQADEIAALKIQLLELRRQLGEPETELTTSKLVRSYCGEEMEDCGEDCWAEESFVALGEAMASENGPREVFDFGKNDFGPPQAIDFEKQDKEKLEFLRENMIFVPQTSQVWEPQVHQERTIDKYNAAKELEKLAVFLKFHYDCDQCKKLEPGCKELRRTYCGQHEEECVEWLMGNESTNWLMELFQRPPVPTPQFAKAEPVASLEPVAEPEPEVPCKTVTFAESLRIYEETLRKEIEAQVHPAASASASSDCYDYEAQQYYEDYEEPVCDDEECLSFKLVLSEQITED
jgi:hypothetical protein